VSEMPAAMAIARQSVRLMRAEWASLLTMLVMPLILMTIFLPVARDALHDAGFHGATGAEQVVPGMTVGFGLFLLGFVAFGFLNERTWRTEERVRATAARPMDIVLGKLVPSFGLAVAYQVVLFVLGAVLFGLRVRGNPFALVLVTPAFAASIVAIGIFVASVATRPQQVNATSNICGLGLSALGGAYVPIALLPLWMQRIAPITPTYWAVKGLRVAFLPGASMATALSATGVLLALALAFVLASARRLR